MLLNILKWLSQFIIVFGGIWALYSPQYIEDKVTKKRELTRRGIFQIAFLCVGFVTFVITNHENKIKAELQNERQNSQIEAQTTTINNQYEQLEYLRKLILYQKKITDFRLSWDLSNQEWQKYEALLKDFYENQKIEDMAYLQSCLKNGQITIYRAGDGWKMQIMLDRPQGLLSKIYDEGTPQWNAFIESMRAILSNRFSVELTSGIELFDLGTENWPTTFFADNGKMVFVINNSKVSLGDIENESIVIFHGGDIRPAKIHLSTTDPKISFDLESEINWQPLEYRKWINYEEQEFVLMYYKSQTLKIISKYNADFFKKIK